MKFNINDVVVRIIDFHDGMKIGDISVVVSVDEDGVKLLDYNTIPSKHDDRKLRLATEEEKAAYFNKQKPVEQEMGYQIY